MLLLHDQKLAIMTPPKCATNSLHAGLRCPPWNGETFVGPSPTVESGCDRHINAWPHEAKRYKKLVVVRDPLTRLVSLYLHWANRLAGYGRAAASFGDFVGLVVAGGGFGEGMATPMYAWNLSRWLADVESDGVLRAETLMADLAAHGIERQHELPRLNQSYRGQDYGAFYTPELLERAQPWALPDCDRFGYEWAGDA